MIIGFYPKRDNGKVFKKDFIGQKTRFSVEIIADLQLRLNLFKNALKDHYRDYVFELRMSYTNYRPL